MNAKSFAFSLAMITIGLGGACGGKVAFDGLPSGGTTSSGVSGSGVVAASGVSASDGTSTGGTSTGGHGGTTSVGSMNVAVTGVGETTGSVNPVGTSTSSGSGGCVNTCAEVITTPCPPLCPGAPATAGDALKFFLECVSKTCATECDNGMMMLKCADPKCNTCAGQKCKMAFDVCANN